MRFNVALPRDTYYNTHHVLALRNVGVQFVNERKKSVVQQLPILHMQELEEILTLAQQHGKISLEIGDDEVPILTLENYK